MPWNIAADVTNEFRDPRSGARAFHSITEAPGNSATKQGHNSFTLHDQKFSVCNPNDRFSQVITSVSVPDLIRYVRLQINGMFPDRNPITGPRLAASVTDALERIEHCFSKISINKYCSEGQTRFDHLYSDQYLMFLWFLSNSLWHRNTNVGVSNKVYLLNKALHGFDCSFSTELPQVFIVVHGVGTVLGKAKYEDYLAVYQGCTVGQAHGKYPTLGRGIGLGAGVAILGDCRLGDVVSVGAGCTLVNTTVPNNSSVFRDKKGALKIQKTKLRAIASEYFSADCFPRS